MKKYLILTCDLFLAGIFLWLFFSNNWFIMFSTKPYTPGENLIPGHYWILSSPTQATEILFLSEEKTNTFAIPEKTRVISLEIQKPATLLLIPKQAKLFAKRGLLVHSFLAGVAIFLGVFAVFWWKATKSIETQYRLLIFALAFGWSGTFSVAFLMLSTFVGFTRWIRKPHWKWYYGLLVLFFLWVIITSLFARFPLDALGSSFLFLIYVIITLSASLEQQKIPWKKIGNAIASALIGATVISLTQQWYLREGVGIWLGENPLLFWPYHPKELVSLFEWSARGGYWLGLMIPVVTALFFRAQEKTHKLVLGFSSVLGFILLVLTQSRGGFIIAFVGIFSQLLFRKKGYLALFLLLIPITMLLVAPDSKWAQSIKNPFTFHTDTQRFHQMRAALDFWREANLFTGIGLMNYRQYYYEKRHDYDIYSVADYLHQGYMAILLETGIIGFLLLYGFFIIVWLTLIRKSLLYRSSFYPMILGTMNALLISFLFDAMLLYAFYLSMWVWFWLGIGEQKELENS